MSDLGEKIVKKDLQIDAEEPSDNSDRPGAACATSAYASAGKLEGNNKTGAYAGAGWGHASAEWSIFDAEAKGPNVGAGVEVSEDNVRAMAKAELASASASAGLVTGTVGLAADTGFGISKSGLEAKVLGTGFSIGRKTGISLFGSGFEIDFGKW
uniref:bifunctional protein GlmU-like n=1 Tax=Semicossyphus pulcher TaxID=241346 RepID=UPI0037E7CB05